MNKSVLALGAYLTLRMEQGDFAVRPLALTKQFSSEADAAMLKTLATGPVLPFPSVPKSGGSGQALQKTLADHKKDRRYPNALFEVVLHNTPRLHKDYVCAILQDIFHQSADRAKVLSQFAPHIHSDAYTQDVARTKMRQVRDDAEARGVPIPYMRCVHARNT